MLINDEEDSKAIQIIQVSMQNHNVSKIDWEITILNFRQIIFLLTTTQVMVALKFET